MKAKAVVFQLAGTVLCNGKTSLRQSTVIQGSGIIVDSAVVHSPGSLLGWMDWLPDGMLNLPLAGPLSL